MGPRNDVLDGGPDPPREGVIFRGEEAARCKASHTVLSCANGWTDRNAVWDVVSDEPQKHVVEGDPESRSSPRVKGQFWGQKGAGPGHARVCLAVDILSDSVEGSTGMVEMRIGVY